MTSIKTKTRLDLMGFVQEHRLITTRQESRNLELYVQGDQEPALILLHELPGLSQQTFALGRYFAEQQFRVVMPLLFGRAGEHKLAANTLRVCLQQDLRQLCQGKDGSIVRVIRAPGLIQSFNTGWAVAAAVPSPEAHRPSRVAAASPMSARAKPSVPYERTAASDQALDTPVCSSFLKENSRKTNNPNGGKGFGVARKALGDRLEDVVRRARGRGSAAGASQRPEMPSKGARETRDGKLFTRIGGLLVVDDPKTAPLR